MNYYRSKLVLIIFFVSLGTVSEKESKGKDLQAGKIPVIYCTDLFHPHDDPDDHFDIACLYAIPEVDIKAVILDQGKRQKEKPGAIPVEQLNYITGKNVPCYIGLADKLNSPEDKGLNQPAEYQGGVEQIIRILKESAEPVVIIAVGSMRDVAAAYNREPELFRKKVDKLYIFIGEASNKDFIEYNANLDANAYRCIMQSDLPVYWVPCFDGGAWYNKGRASFWQAQHADLLRDLAPEVMNYFIYALVVKAPKQNIEFLDKKVNEEYKRKLLAGKRNLWCTAVFTHIADRKIIWRGDRYISIPKRASEKSGQVIKLFTFEDVSVAINEKGNTIDKPESAHKVKCFKVVDKDIYAEAMTSVTADMLSHLGRQQH